MKKNSTRESPPQPSEQPQPRHRNAYDCEGEYEFLFAQHWTALVERDWRRLHDTIKRLFFLHARFRSPHAFDYAPPSAAPSPHLSDRGRR